MEGLRSVRRRGVYYLRCMCVCLGRGGVEFNREGEDGWKDGGRGEKGGLGDKGGRGEGWGHVEESEVFGGVYTCMVMRNESAGPICPLDLPAITVLGRR